MKQHKNMRKGSKHTEEAKKKNSLSKLGKPSWNKGVPFSAEAKRKMSLARLGKTPWNKGIPQTEELRKKNSDSHKGQIGANKGRKFPSPSRETRRKLSDALRGEKGANWQGGKTAQNHIIRNSLEYRLWRNAIFERDNFTCIWCGLKGGKLNADHIKPFAFFPELRFAIDNGRTLCEPCHRTTDTWGEGAKKYQT